MMEAGIEKPDLSFPAFFRFRKVDGDYVVTNAQGDFVILTAAEFKAFGEGTVARDSELWGRLARGNFIRSEFDVPAAVERLKRRKQFLHGGPNLHMLVVTLRCNETCVYCHASRADMDAVSTDMSKETAEKAVDLILQSPSPFITIEFQGGEPLVNYPVLQHAIEYARERNSGIGKRLEFTMVSNLALMTEEKLAWLLDRKVQICTSIDGPEHLHDKQRKLVASSAFKAAVYWIDRINKAYLERGLDPSLYHVEALLTTTREALSYPREIVDTYAALGCRAIYLRPVDPFGFAARTGAKVGYASEEFLAFYRAALDHVIALNAQGTQMIERFAAIFLTKILTDSDPNFLDIRSPCGAGIGQVTYNHDGSIYTCDEGRMLADAGDPMFRIGHVKDATYRSVVGHPTVRALTIASNLDAQPGCSQCVYRPYCGVCPVYNHAAQGDIHGRMRESRWCETHMGILDLLFEKLTRGDEATVKTLTRWTTTRPRAHFVHE